MIVIYWHAPLLFVAIVAASGIFGSAADRAFAVLRGKHRFVLSRGHPEKPLHSAAAVAFLNYWIVLVSASVAFALFAINTLKMAATPRNRIIGDAASARPPFGRKIRSPLDFPALAAALRCFFHARRLREMLDYRKVYV